jgi:transposase
VVQHQSNKTEKTMSKKELYKQKMRAQLDEWEAEVDKFKAKASGASANVQLELNKNINAMKDKIEQGKSKLAEIADASEDSWESIKAGVDSAWDSLGAAVSDAKAKLKG